MTFEALYGVGFSQIIIGAARASGLMISAPLFQNRTIIPQVKIVLALGLALLAAPFIKTTADFNSFTLWMAIFTLIQEVLVGMIMGFMVNITMYAVQLAGYFADTSIGFGIVNMLDPNTGSEIPLTGQLNSIMAILVFLGVNGHHVLIVSFIQSFSVIQPGALVLKNAAVWTMLKAFTGMFALGVQIAVPILGTIFLADVAMGIISKLIPQINVFVIGFSIKIILGLLVLIFFIPIYITLVESVFSPGGDAFRLMRLMLRTLH